MLGGGTTESTTGEASHALSAGMWPWETRSVVFYDALRLREAQWYVLFVSGSSFPPLPAHVVLVYWDCGTKLILPSSRLTRLHVVVCSHCDARK